MVFRTDRRSSDFYKNIDNGMIDIHMYSVNVLLLLLLLFFTLGRYYYYYYYILLLLLLLLLYLSL